MSTVEKPENHAKEEDESFERRNVLSVLGAIGGAFVGVRALSGCAGPVESNMSTGQIEQALNKVNGAGIGWADAIVGTGNLETMKGVPSNSSGISIVIARGYAMPGDGGGGVFNWISDAVTPDNGGTVIVPTIAGWTRTGCWKRLFSGPVDVRWFGAKGDGIAPSGAAINKAIQSLGATGGSVYIPSGTYKIVAATRLVISLANVRLFGDGAASVLRIDDPGVGSPAVSSFNALEINAPYVTIEHLRFLGLNNPFGGVVNYVAAQMTAILVSADDVTVASCLFERLFGHTVQCYNNSRRVHVLSCVVRNCSNGINVNSDSSRQEGNFLENTNGIESAGSNTVIANNILKNSSGISIGGNTTPPQTENVVCTNNLIIRPSPSGVTPSVGIACVGAKDVVISNNVLLDVDNHGIIVVNSDSACPGCQVVVSGAVSVLNNRINTLKTGTTSRHGIWIQTGVNSIVSGNDVEAFFAGILVDANGVVVTNNRCSGIIAGDIAVQYAQGVRIASNVLVNSDFRTFGAPSFTSDSSHVGFFGAAPRGRPTVDTSAGDTQTLANLLTALASLGLIAR